MKNYNEHERWKKIEEAQRRAVRLEAQRRRRLINTEVKNVVAKIEKQLQNKMQKELEKKNTQQLKPVSQSMEQIAEGLGSRLEDVSEEVDRMGSKIRALDKCNRGNTKRMKKNAGSLGDLKSDLKSKCKTLREDHDKLIIRLAKEKKVADRLNKQFSNANARLVKEQEKTKSLVKKLSRRKRKKSFEKNSPPATRAVSPLPPQPSQPAQMMQWGVSGQTPQRFVPRADTPRPNNVGQPQPRQYVSPIYASRNLLR